MFEWSASFSTQDITTPKASSSSVYYVWQHLKSIGLVTGPGGLFATRLVTESGGLATNPPRYSTLHRGSRQGFVTEGPRQRYVTEGRWGDRHKLPFRVTAIYICLYIYIHIMYRASKGLLHHDSGLPVWTRMVLGAFWDLEAAECMLPDEGFVLMDVKAPSP